MSHRSMSWRLLLAFWLTLAPGLAIAAVDEERDQRARAVYVVDVLPGGSAEKAMAAYNQWLKGEGANFPRGEGVRFETLSDGDKAKLLNLMVSMYGVAGEGAKAFKNVALLIDKGLQNPSGEFARAGHSAEPIDDRLSVLMAEARDAMIEKVVNKIGQEKKWKIARSDSGNTTSGMKSDLDQTFYVFEYDEATGEWVRKPDLDKTFIDLFKSEWGEQNRTLSLDMLDIASIEGKNRFPDPRATEIVEYGRTFSATVVELRTTPGAYTTYGAVLQQMQLRALGAILAGNPRSFQQYGPPDGMPDGPWGKQAHFDADLARDTMFGAGRDPKIVEGLAFGAAVANQHELEHYMDAEKFETKYHLRTWDDALFTERLLRLGEGAGAKVEYTSLSADERAKFNQEMLGRLFPNDPRAQRIHALALDASADLRNFHKGALSKIPGLEGVSADVLSDYDKKKAIFEKLAMELYPTQYVADPKTDAELESNKRIIADVETHHHRQLANEFCLRSIFETSSQTLGLLFALDGRDRGWIDPDKLRHVMQEPPGRGVTPLEQRAQWEKIKNNLRAGARETLLYAMYDLGPAESAKLRDFLKARHPGFAVEIDKLWQEGKWKGWASLVEHRDIYARYYKGKAAAYMGKLTDQVRRHVISELGFEKVEASKIAGAVLGHHQHMTWNWRKFARNAVWDPGSIDALAQVVRTYFESGGDPDAVRDKVFDEMLLALPVFGQLESARRGGIAGIGLMALAIKFPPVGAVLLAYSLGEAAYAIYDVEYQQPHTGNIVDAIYRGYAGPETIGFGEPGNPGPIWSDERVETLNAEMAKLQGEMGFTGAAIAPEKREAIQVRMDQVNKELAELKALRAQIEEYGGGNWLGGKITGTGAVTDVRPFRNWILNDIDPQIGFFTKATVDLRVLGTIDPMQLKAEIKRLSEVVDSAADVHERLDASMKLHELALQKKRYDEALRWVALADKHRELRFRFHMDSLFPSFHAKYTVTSQGRVNQWVDEWWAANDEAVIAELVEIGLLDASVQEAYKQDSFLTKAGERAPPVDLEQLKARLNADMARSRHFFAAWEEQEKQRLAVSERNLEAARAFFGMEMTRPRPEHLESEQQRDMAAALRWFAAPRLTPQLQAAVYRIVPPPLPDDAPGAKPESTQDKEKLEPKHDWSVATKLTVDPSIYFEPYLTRVDYLDLGKAQAAASSGKVGDLPLLPGIADGLKALVAQHKSADKQSNDVVVLVSAVASDMADLTHAMPETIAHLPRHQVSAGGTNGYLMAQALSFAYIPDEEEEEPEEEVPAGPLHVEATKDEHNNTIVIVTSDQIALLDDENNKPPGQHLVLRLERSFSADGPFEPVPQHSVAFERFEQFKLLRNTVPINADAHRGRIAVDRVRFMPSPVRYTNNKDNQFETEMLSPHQPLYFRVVQWWSNTGSDEIGKSVSNVTEPGEPELTVNLMNVMRDDVAGDTYSIRGSPTWVNVAASLGLSNQGFQFWGAKLTVATEGFTGYAWTTDQRAGRPYGGPGWNSSFAQSRVPYRPGGNTVTVTVETDDGLRASRTIQFKPKDADNTKEQEALEKFKAQGPVVSRWKNSFDQAEQRREMAKKALDTAEERVRTTPNDQNWSNWGRQHHQWLGYTGEFEDRYRYEQGINDAMFQMSLGHRTLDADMALQAALKRVAILDPDKSELIKRQLGYLDQHIQISDQTIAKVQDEKLRKPLEAEKQRYVSERAVLLPQTAKMCFDTLERVKDAAALLGDIGAIRAAAARQLELIDAYGSQLGFHTQSQSTFDKMDTARSDRTLKIRVLKELADDVANLAGDREGAAKYFDQMQALTLENADPDKRDAEREKIQTGWVPDWYPPEPVKQ